MSKSLTDRECIPGISWLRALLSVSVVAWHMNSFGKSLIFDKNGYVRHVFTLSDLINFQVLILAVPTFFLISCYLYARKNHTMRYCKERVGRFAILAVSWTVAIVIWISGYRGLVSLRPTSLQSFMMTVLSAGHTLYYFFVSLIILTIVTHIFSKLSTILNVIMFVLACVLIFVLPQITITYSLYALSAFWNPMNFVPYPFAAILFARYERFFVERNPQLFIIIVLLAAATLAGFYEWRFYINGIFFDGQGYALPAYTRLSVVCLSILLLSIGLTKRIRTNGVIDFMSKQSLSLYCLHPFFIVSASEFFSLPRLPFSPFLIEMFKLMVLLLVCYSTSLLLKKILSKDIFL